MGFFSKKVKIPEEIFKDMVVDELQHDGNLNLGLRAKVIGLLDEAMKNNSSLDEMLNIYEEEVLNIYEKIDKFSESSIKNLSVEEVAIDFADLPVETKNFFDKISQKPLKVYKFNENFKYVAKVLEKLTLGIPAHIFITTADNIKLEYVESFASIAYNFAFYEEIKAMSHSRRKTRRKYGGADSGPSVFTILITENVSEDDLPNLIPGDWAGQTNKSMIYDSSKKALYGKNGIHMKFFKKVLKQWGSVEDLHSNKKYFTVNIL